MKVEQTSKSGIRFNVELTDAERESIREDLVSHIEALGEITESAYTDEFLREIKKIL